MNWHKTKWSVRRVEGRGTYQPQALETYHNGVLGEALPHVLYKLNKVFWVAVCHVQAYIFHLGNSFQDLFQLFKVRRSCAWACRQMLERDRASGMSQVTQWAASGAGKGRVGPQEARRDAWKTGIRKGSGEDQHYLKTLGILASKLFPLLEAVVFMDSCEEGELGRRKSHQKGEN